MYGKLWVMAWEYLVEIVTDMMNFNPHKKLNYQRGLKVLSMLDNIEFFSPEISYHSSDY